MYILKTLFSILKNFFKLEAKWYAYLYLLLIPLFGTIYYFHVESFYQSNNAYEKNNEKMILKEISNYIHPLHANILHSNAKANIAKKCFTPDLINRELPNVNEKLLSLFMKLEFNDYTIIMGKHYRNKRLGKTRNGFNYKMHLKFTKNDLNTIEKESNEELKEFLYYYIDQVPIIIDGKFEYSQSSINEPYRSFLMAFEDDISNTRCNFKRSEILGTEAILLGSRVYPILDQAINSYYNYLKGKPSVYGSKLSNYIRMIYFSTITITTLGYGDIVPVSDFTRILVSLESILGIILIGLFLNAITHNNK